MLSRLFTLALLATTAACNPIAQAPEPTSTVLPTSATATKTTSTRTRPESTRVCVLTDGPNPVIIEKFARPDCVCRCYREACESLNAKGSREDFLACINKHFGPNPVNFGTEMIAAYGACVGGTRCIQ
ncbi:hypothetical protein B0T14DRAFT_568865 [Immersiella caudata]|uniref:Uncharacterized protein n=1 Tax=Immersiella caudata TaxID=314043 RepID=A0AA39WL48_9PEZI|nr:hypothetical protein B0T14DRAFT_568865 [Immersiella caudata]